MKVPTLDWVPGLNAPRERALEHEWLTTNGLGGYAMGTIANCNTRKYHGLFIPQLPELGRTVMLSRLDETAFIGDGAFRLDGGERDDGHLDLPGLALLERFFMHGLVPTWELRIDDARLSRSLVLVHGEHTLYVVYRHLGGPPLSLCVRPYPVFRSHDGPMRSTPEEVSVRLDARGVEMTCGAAPVSLKARVAATREVPFIATSEQSPLLRYRVEVARGYEATEALASPGYFMLALEPGEQAAFAATIEEWHRVGRAPHDVLGWEFEREERLLQYAAKAGTSPVAARLTLAADQFVVTPSQRPRDEGWASASGQQATSIIAGYPWFTDWGRDTMISLEGLTLCTGRPREASAILRTFARYVKDGLVPNYFPEGANEGRYHTADATLWFFHALERYERYTHDDSMLKELWPTLEDIIEHHVRGTRFHIGVDPNDGLLRQGEPGYQLTWMDALVDGWVVTPRRGKAVEINALWFNALSLMAQWARRQGRDPTRFEALASRAQQSFNQRFCNEQTGCLFDVVDGEAGDDSSVRPNQIFAVSLTHPVLRREWWPKVMRAVHEQLLTPVGLRTLTPQHADFRAAYDGDLRARDAAYHQGTVWPWLLGHYVDAALKVGAPVGEVHALLLGLKEHLLSEGVGSISEIFDATAPFKPRGCVAQAWSVAETFRAWLVIEEGLETT